MDKFLIKERGDSSNKGESMAKELDHESTSIRSRSPHSPFNTVTDEEANIAINSEIKKSKQGNKRNKISFVWRYFKKSSDRKIAKCLKCGREYRTSGNTSNLSDHLKRFHPILHTDDDSDMETRPSSSASGSSNSTQSISSYFKKSLLYDNTSQRKQQLDSALLNLIVLDLQPFSVVTDKGFKQFVQLLDPRYELPSTSTLRDKLLKEAYLECYSKLKREIDKVEHLSITFDGWTSVTTESYITVTCHYVDNDFKLKSAVLSTKPLVNGVNHTAENLSQTLNDIFTEWGINEKVVCIVTDSAANMIKTCTLLQKRHIPCYAHMLNLVVQDSLPCIQDLIKKVKDIVSYFRSSYVAMDAFKKEQNTNEPLKLIQEVNTRWNSTYHMIERIIKTNEAVNAALLQLRKAPMPLTAEEVAVLKEVELILKCFEVSKKIQGNEYVTISLIIPLTFGIYNHLTHLLEDNITTEEGKSLGKSLIESIKKRLFQYETRSTTRLGTMLDPRFKKEGFRTIDNATAAATLLEVEMFSALKKQKQALEAEAEKDEKKDEEPRSSSSTSNILNFLQTRIKEKEKSLTADVIITKRQYLERANSSNEIDPLLFWKVTGMEMNPLQACAKKFFCIPASSAESERVFSKTGQIIEQRRSRLKPKNVNMMVFLNKNFKINM